MGDRQAPVGHVIRAAFYRLTPPESMPIAEPWIIEVILHQQENGIGDDSSKEPMFVQQSLFFSGSRLHCI